MAVDQDFIERFQKETNLLKNLQKRISEAIDRAEDRIAKMKEGKLSKEEIFGAPPKK